MSAVNQQELERAKLEEESYFGKLKDHPYRLHAVICHGGGTNAGHYWVWIHDFEKDRWLKYNDSRVTEDARDSQSVLDELNSGGDPYYLAYVRQDQMRELVEIPTRTVAPPAPEAEAEGRDVEMQTIEGIEPENNEPPPPPLVPRASF
jgi:ubiquitin carboxyl-terminal hydrolase 25